MRVFFRKILIFAAAVVLAVTMAAPVLSQESFAVQSTGEGTALLTEESPADSVNPDGTEEPGDTGDSGDSENPDDSEETGDPEEPGDSGDPENPDEPLEPETLDAPVITDFQTVNRTLILTWEPVEGAESYQVEYAQNRLFMTKNPTLRTIDNPETTSFTCGLSSSKTYYARVRALKTSETGEITSIWAFSPNCRNKTSLSLKSVKKSGSRLELRGTAKQKVGGYDTIQGSCVYNKSGFFVLYNRKNGKCKILKMNMKTKRKVKVSAALPLSHGSDITYDPVRKRLCVAHGPSNYRKVSFISSKTLKIISTITLTCPAELEGATASQCRKFKGITAIAFNEKHDCYVARLKTMGHVMIFDHDMNPVRLIPLVYMDKQLYQGMDSVNDFILLGQSRNSGPARNYITVYDWNGNYITTLSMSGGMELESIYRYNNDVFVSLYTSYYKTWYKDGKRKKSVIGTRRNVPKKKKFLYTKLLRYNYIYKVSGI